MLRLLPLATIVATVPLAWWVARWPFSDLFSGYATAVAFIGFVAGAVGLWTVRRESRGIATRPRPNFVYLLCGVALVTSLVALATVYAEDEAICGANGPVSCGGDGRM